MVTRATLSSGSIVGQTGSFATNWNTSPTTSAVVVLTAQHQVLFTIRRTSKANCCSKRQLGDQMDPDRWRRPQWQLITIPLPLQYQGYTSATIATSTSVTLAPGRS